MSHSPWLVSVNNLLGIPYRGLQEHAPLSLFKALFRQARAYLVEYSIA